MVKLEYTEEYKRTIAANYLEKQSRPINNFIISAYVLISVAIISFLHIPYLYNQKMAVLHQQFPQSLSLSLGHHLQHRKALRKCTVLQDSQSPTLSKCQRE